MFKRGTNGIRTIYIKDIFYSWILLKPFWFKSCGNHVEVVVIDMDMLDMYCPFLFVFKITEIAEVSAVSGRSVEPGSLCDWLRHGFGIMNTNGTP